MGGEERRERLVALLGSADVPVSGADLARELGVSRQVIVQDIALIRRDGVDVASTHRGYVLARPSVPRRMFKVRHGEERVQEELDLIVDLGATVEDVVVNHRSYGVISVALGVSSRRDVTLPGRHRHEQVDAAVAHHLRLPLPPRDGALRGDPRRGTAGPGRARLPGRASAVRGGGGLGVALRPLLAKSQVNAAD